MPSNPLRAVWGGIAATVVAGGSGQGHAADFHGVGILPDAPYGNQVVAMSASGRALVITGRTALQGPSETHSSAWTALGGFTAMQSGPSGTSSIATGMSADGAYVTGSTYGPGGSNLVRWSSDGQIVRTYGTTGGLTSMFPQAVVSGNGDFVAGSRLLNREAFRWSEGQGFEIIYSGNNVVKDVQISESGGLVVGANVLPTIGERNPYSGWAWTPGTGFRFLEGNYLSQAPQVIAPDGSFIIGTYASDNFQQGAFALVRWAPDGSAHILFGPETFSNRRSFIATGVDSAGALIVGNMANYPEAADPTVWTLGGGFVPLAAYFDAAGVDFDGWTLKSVSKLSADGLTFAGVGINPDGQRETWIATIPAPGAVAVIGWAAVVCGRRRR